ncbi:MAG: hypothetical protein IKW92_07130 [Firmicutes bacterium]|nr:hypothetical protein [Bacillota bacterium]
MKNKHEHITAFYIETILLIVCFIAVILLLTNVFGLGKLESTKAKDLTNAVRLAESAAERFAAAEGPAELTELLNEGENASIASTSSQYPVEARSRQEALIFAYYDKDLKPATFEEGPYYMVQIFWKPQTNKDATLADGKISVYRTPNTEDPIYELETAVYIQEAGR